MKTIEIEDDLYAFLASKTQHIGESASSILRRVLPMDGEAPQTKDAVAAGTHELSELLGNAGFQFRSPTDKYLAILADAWETKGTDFENIFSIRGRERVYFAASREEIVRSGTSTQPLQIPGTRYWAMTNSPTSQKQALIRQVLKLLGYSEAAYQAAYRAVN